MKTKTCSNCNLKKSISEFYASKDHSQRVMCYCKACFCKFTIERWINRKLAAIAYKGNEYEKCGITLEKSHYSIFEFHHKDPSKKNYSWTKLRLRSQKDINKELDKCDLLCANCHRLIHYNLGTQRDSNSHNPITVISLEN